MKLNRVSLVVSGLIRKYSIVMDVSVSVIVKVIVVFGDSLLVISGCFLVCFMIVLIF